MLFAYTQPKLASTETVFPAMQRNIKPHCHARDEEDTCPVTMIFVLTPDDMKKSGVGERMVQLSLNLLVSSVLPYFWIFKEVHSKRPFLRNK